MKISFILSFQQHQEILYSRSQRQNEETHEPFEYEPMHFSSKYWSKLFFQEKEGRRGIFWIRERAGENGKRGAARLKTCSGKEIWNNSLKHMLFLSFYTILLSHFLNFIINLQDEFERRRKARELANGGAVRKVRRVTHHYCKFLFNKS